MRYWPILVWFFPLCAWEEHFSNVNYAKSADTNWLSCCKYENQGRCENWPMCYNLVACHWYAWLAYIFPFSLIKRRRKSEVPARVIRRFGDCAKTGSDTCRLLQTCTNKSNTELRSPNGNIQVWLGQYRNFRLKICIFVGVYRRRWKYTDLGGCIQIWVWVKHFWWEYTYLKI